MAFAVTVLEFDEVQPEHPGVESNGRMQFPSHVTLLLWFVYVVFGSFPDGEILEPLREDERTPCDLVLVRGFIRLDHTQEVVPGLLGIHPFFGDEIELGKKEIDGQTAQGFTVTREDEEMTQTITVWADEQTGHPLVVEIEGRSSRESVDPGRGAEHGIEAWALSEI